MERPVTDYYWESIEEYLRRYRGMKRATVTYVNTSEESTFDIVATFTTETNKIEQTVMSIPWKVFDALEADEAAHLIYVNRRPTGF